MMAFSAKTRVQDIEKLKSEQFDLLVVGGGITGAGVAIQGAAAGMKTVLLEMQDFGAGTSSRSTRLVHGGIRYLKTFDVEVVSDTVKERAIVQHIAPHMTTPDPMLLPIYDEPGTTFTMFSVKVAMDLYDHLAGVDTNPALQKYANYTLSKEEVLKREPQLNPDHLVGGGVYLDYQNNDSRLVVENIKKAHAEGGTMVSHVKVTGMLYDDQGKVNGVKAYDMQTQRFFEVHAKVVLNAAGPWSDKVRHLDANASRNAQMRPTKGVHLVVDQSRLTVPQPTYFGSGTNDGRMIFTIPREGKTYFGTTDTDFRGKFEDPQVDQSDVDYLLKIINKKYPSAHLTIDDVEASWAGIRPLIAAEEPETETDAVSGASAAASLSAPSAVSRGSSLKVAPDGLVTLAGGKLTDYRVMANGAMDKVREILQRDFGEQFKAINSAEIKVAGGDFDSDNVEQAMADFSAYGEQQGASAKEAREIAVLYGANSKRIFDDMAALSAGAAGLSKAETAALHYSLNEEMVLDAVDYLLRRTYHILFSSKDIDRIKGGVLAEMAKQLGWDDAETQRQSAAVDAEIRASRLVDLKAAK
jgi:alpha-glycerophosphate oxidase